MNLKKYFELSMLKLLEKKSIDDITVNEIIKDVGSCKGSFYKYYVDKYDLCNKSLQTHVYSQISREGNNYRQYVLNSLEVFEKYAKVLTHAFDSSDLNSTRRYHENRVIEQLKTRAKDNKELFENPLYIYSINFYGVTITNILYEWLKDVKRKPKESVLDLLRAVIPQMLYNLNLDDQ